MITGEDIIKLNLKNIHTHTMNLYATESGMYGYMKIAIGDNTFRAYISIYYFTMSNSHIRITNVEQLKDGSYVKKHITNQLLKEKMDEFANSEVNSLLIGLAETYA